MKFSSVLAMESLRKSLKAFQSQAKQQNHPEEETQALLHNHEQSSNSDTQKEDIFVEIDTDNASGKETSAPTSSSKFAGSSKKLKVSFGDVLTEVVRQRSKDLPDQDSRFRSLNASFGCRSWRSVVNKTKSRLIDPPEERYQRTETADYGEDSEEERDDHHEENDSEDIPEEYKKMTLSGLTMFQRVILVLITAALVCSLSVPVLRKLTLWDLPLWKWEIMVLALISGHLVSGWGIKVAVIFFEPNLVLRKRVLYFVYGLRKSVQNCLWLGLVLLVWHWVFNKKVEETKSKILQYVTKILICLLVGTFIWLLKTLIVKVLASSFHVNTYFDRIQEALFNQYVIETLCGPPVFETQSTEEEEDDEGAGPSDLKATLLANTVGKRPRFSRKSSRKKEEEISIHHLHKLNHKNISAWNMRRMINIVRHGALCTLDEQILNSNIEDESLFHIRSENQAKEAAKKIYLKVAKTGSQ